MMDWDDDVGGFVVDSDRDLRGWTILSVEPDDRFGKRWYVRKDGAGLRCVFMRADVRRTLAREKRPKFAMPEKREDPQ